MHATSLRDNLRIIRGYHFLARKKSVKTIKQDAALMLLSTINAMYAPCSSPSHPASGGIGPPDNPAALVSTLELDVEARALVESGGASAADTRVEVAEAAREARVAVAERAEADDGTASAGS